jgi:hypothetical protein
MIPCGDDRWCCESDIQRGQCDCVSGIGTFAVQPGKAVAVVAVVDGKFTVTTGAAVPTNTGPIVQPSSLVSTDSSSSTLKTTAKSSSTSSTTPSAAQPNTSSTTNGQTPTNTRSNLALTSTASSIPDSSVSGSLPHKAILGLSIAFSILVALIIVFVVIWCLRKRFYRRPPPPDLSLYGPTGGQRDSLIGPPMEIPPNPNPYSDSLNTSTILSVSNTFDRGLSQIRHDVSGMPLRDPYAAAARRADTMTDHELEARRAERQRQAWNDL